MMNRNTAPNRFQFGTQQSASAAQAQQDKPKAQFWLNVGYPTGDPKYPFVSLPNGIPLDLSDRQELRGSPEYTAFLSAQNDLLEQVVAQAEGLEPGEDMIIQNDGSPLAFQIRRVRGEAEATPAEENALARPNLFAARENNRMEIPTE